MLNDGDRAQMQKDFQSILEDREASIVIHRGETTLAAQSVRIAGLSSHSMARGEASREMRAGIIVCGAPDLDIAVDDRFNIAGNVYRVRFIRPNRDAGTQAEVEVIE
jgi:hypothetical protein